MMISITADQNVPGPWSRLQASMCAHCRHKGENQSEMKALSVALVVMFKNNYNVVLLGINVAN